jgi:hypothetical protein
MDEERLREIEWEVSVGRTLPGRHAYSLRIMTELVAEVRRLRGWLQTVDDATEQVDEPCGWCLELQGWAKNALDGTPLDAAVVRDER